MNELSIRWMIRRDMAEILDIESDVFDDPWPEEDFIRTLRRRNCIGMVAEQCNKVVGYMVYELHKSSIGVLNFAVHRKAWRQGIGTSMIEKLVKKLSPQRRRNVVLRVREANLDGQLFFRSCGFVATGIDADYYVTEAGLPESAYRMVLTARAFESQCRRVRSTTI